MADYMNELVLAPRRLLFGAAGLLSDRMPCAAPECEVAGDESVDRCHDELCATARGPAPITLTPEQAKALFDALDTGLGAATQVADDYHASMKGYRPHRHKAVDDDAAQISSALTVLGQLIESRPAHTNGE